MPPLPEGALLVTLDVSSLYTFNIPIEEGVRASAKALLHHRDPQDKPATHEIVKLLRLVLHCNNFEFNCEHFLQTSGTAMGTKVAPSYANIFMADLEANRLLNFPSQPEVWWRFIDDIFCIWTHGEANLQEFVNHLNSCHPTIKFTEEHSSIEIPYLDTLVKFDENNSLYTSLYTKPTDTHTYLHFRSAHPKHCKTAGPHGQLLRVKRICTRPEDFEHFASKILHYYKLRGYPPRLLNDTMGKVRGMARDTLLQQRPPQHSQHMNQNKLFMITQYHPTLPPVKNIIQENWNTIQASKYGSFLGDKEVIIGYRRATNLKDILVKSRTRYNPTQPNIPVGTATGRNQCSTNNCRYCPIIDVSGTAKSSHTGRTYSTPQGGSCKRNNLIYLLTCRTCNKQYVGQTSRALMDRLREHFYYINKRDLQQPLGRHFARADHQGLQLQAQILEYIPTAPKLKKSETLRLKKEYHWIHQLVTMEPFGLNVMGK